MSSEVQNFGDPLSFHAQLFPVLDQHHGKNLSPLHPLVQFMIAASWLFTVHLWEESVSLFSTTAL